jgi:signal transduction histidine kinase
MDFRKKYLVPILFFTVLLILFFNLGQWFIYSKVRTFSETVFRDNLIVQTQLAASSFDGEIINQLNGIDFIAQDLIDVQARLNRLGSEYNFFNVMLLDLIGEPLLGYDDDSDTTVLGLEYDLAPFLSASAGIPAGSHLIASGSLYLISAYAPVFDDLNQVVAVLGVDADYKFFKSLADFKNNLIYINILSLLFIVLFGLVFVIINRRLMAAQEVIYQTSALSSMGQMAATMAHEIKNPLGIIKATASRIKSKYGKDSDDRIFDFISEEVDRLNTILAGYLDFAKPADLHTKLKSIDLKLLVEEMLKQCRTDFALDKIEVQFEASDNSHMVLDDGIGLRQAILNLIINVREVYSDGGLLRVELKHGRDNHRLRIIDRGGGIKKEIRRKLFDPFATTKAQGSGLGLYVSKKLIEQFGGKLTLKNNSEGGVTAEIVLPKYRES